ncbi:MAG: hypothetical protein WAW11_03130 [Patescibacteria group bacterium]
MSKILLNLEEKILAVLSLIMTWGALIYYLFNLSWLGVIATLILSFGSYYFIQDKLDKPENHGLILLPKSKILTWWPIIIYFCLIASAFFLLFKNVNDSALISPWSALPKSFFLIYFIATGWLFFILNRKLKIDGSKWLIRIHYLLTFGIAAIVYKIGYGFDPFIHGATMELIDKKGLVLPKPLYYLGQYSLIVILHKLSGISIYLLNKFLVPVLAALLLPSALFKFLKHRGHSKKIIIIVLAVLALPFNIFILSTPQNLSYLWTLLLILYSLAGTNRYLVILLGLATLSIHPLSGLPAILLIGFLEASKLKGAKRRLLDIALWLGTALALPLAFIVSSGGSLKQLSFSWHNLQSALKPLAISTNSGNVLLNYCYLLANNWLFIFIALSIFGLIIWFKKERQEVWLLLKIMSALLVSFLLVSSLSFDFLISYERSDYPIRIMVVIALLAIPACLLAVDYINTKIGRADKTEIISAWLLISILIGCSLYLSYPRLDAYHNSKGYSVSASDVTAVKLIDNQATQKYIVLANQQTSVAALKELGFDNYLKTPAGEIFFYPIPTGGQLYQYYLDMVYKKPDQKIMRSAMNLAGVKESYFVINKYWTFSNRIIAEAKLQADTFWNINNGEIYIFKYSY